MQFSTITSHEGRFTYHRQFRSKSFIRFVSLSGASILQLPDFKSSSPASSPWRRIKLMCVQVLKIFSVPVLFAIDYNQTNHRIDYDVS